jgi:gliding motility-associated-like protein
MKNIIKLSMLLLAIMIVPKSALATHVVGGNFEVCQIGPNDFSVTLRVYRDCNPGNSPSISPSGIEVRDNVTNALITSLNFTGSQVGTSTIINLGDSCYSPTGICVEERIFNQTVNLADNPNGYYIAWDICCRNGLISNADVGTSGSPSEGATFYVQIPDPALPNGNCSPYFGGYPTDGYFCLSNDINNPYVFDPAVIDNDGDSLVFSLINPYNDGTTQKPFNLLGWQAGHSAVNLLGNTTLPNMVINSQTGVVICYPENVGVYVFAILVEEYRGGVKIGEVVRDVQYSSLSCNVDAPPVINLEDTVQITVGEQICIDMYINDVDGTDTIYLQPTSIDFNLSNYVAPNSNGTDSYYLDFYGNDTLWIPYFNYDGTTFTGVGEVPVRYCWTPACDDINETYHINLLAYSLGCSGSDTAQKDIAVQVVYNPPLVLLNIPDSISITFGESTCIELLANDTTNLGDTLFMGTTSPYFNINSGYEPPVFAGNTPLGTMHYYTDFQGQDTVWIENYSLNFATIVGGLQQVAMRYCWTADCEAVFLEDFDLYYTAYSSSCGTDTITKTSSVHIDPPQSERQPTPNIFSPNGDGENDKFKIRGINDPCYDSLSVVIFNRWGLKVYETNDPLFQWDGTNKGGTDCASGVYFVLINGTYGSKYNPATGLQEPIDITEQFTLQLVR